MAAQIDNLEEFEKKLIITDQQWNDLIQDRSSSVKIFTDLYYEDFNYGLTTKDVWLRKRIFEDQETFELKIPKIEDHASSLVDVYDEYTKIEEIKEKLFFQGDFVEFLENKFFVFCNIQTKRETVLLTHFDSNFSHIGFKFTKDVVTSKDQYGWNYSICELEYSYGPELILEQKEQLTKEMFKHFGWNYEYRYGKVLEYLKNFSPDHFKKLIHAGVCPPYPENIAVI